MFGKGERLTISHDDVVRLRAADITPGDPFGESDQVVAAEPAAWYEWKSWVDFDGVAKSVKYVRVLYQGDDGEPHFARGVEIVVAQPAQTSLVLTQPGFLPRLRDRVTVA